MAPYQPIGDNSGAGLCCLCSALCFIGFLCLFFMSPALAGTIIGFINIVDLCQKPMSLFASVIIADGLLALLLLPISFVYYAKNQQGSVVKLISVNLVIRSVAMIVLSVMIGINQSCEGTQLQTAGLVLISFDVLFIISCLFTCCCVAVGSSPK